MIEPQKNETGAATATVSEVNAKSQAHDAVGNETRDGGGGNKEHRNVTFDWVQTNTLIPHPVSKKLYGDTPSESLRKCIEHEGIHSPLIVTRETAHVLSGNSRLAVAKDLKIESVPVLYREEQLSEEEEIEIIVSSNSGRDKTNEIKIREFQEYLRIEKPLALLRKTNARRGKNEVPILEPAKSRDRAAGKVGVSASSLETGIKVLEAMGKLTEGNHPAEAEELRQALNEQGFAPALNLAQEKGWHAVPAAKKVVKAPQADPRNALTQPKPIVEPTVAEVEQKKTQADASHREVFAVEQEEPYGEAEGVPVADGNTKEAHVPEIAVDKDLQAAAERAGEYLDKVATFLRSKEVLRMSEEQKTQLGKDIGKVNRLAKIAEIKIAKD